jgi:hypothetical protein
LVIFGLPLGQNSLLRLDASDTDTDPNPSFQVSPDPDPIQILDFEDQKFKKNTTKIFLHLFLIKNCNLLIPRLGLHKGRPSLIAQKRNPAEHPAFKKM